MNVVESLRMSWRAIRNHRLRSGLTTLGVIIGVAAVITFVTLGASLQAAVVGEVTGGQSPSMQVAVGPDGGDGAGPPGDASQPVFTERDVDALGDLDGVAAVVPTGTVPLSGVRYRGQTLGYSRLTATTPAYFEHVTTRNFTAGGPFALGEREVVLNRPAAALFGGNVSAGDTITLLRPGGEPVNATVAGVLAGGGGGGVFGGTSQPQVYAPVDPFYETRLTTPGAGTEQRAYPTLTVAATAFDRVGEVEERVEAYLETESDARELKPGAYDFVVQTPADVIEQIQEIVGLFTDFVTGVAVIALVVGAIGIANIMLVSVTERTREIGIMKAVGAQNRDVLQLFLVQAVLLGVAGALAGIVVGVIAAALAAEYIGMALTFPLEWVGIAVAVGVGVGVVSGLCPAWNAARTDPIDALRHE